LNDATQKDHYPLPFVDAILDLVAGHRVYSFLDGHASYTQVQIRPEDQLKTTFITDWGTFASTRMPFGLCNGPKTFQRIMMVIFQEFLGKGPEIFIDDFYIFRSDEEHLNHLSQNFNKYLEARLYLHPEKCFFGMQ
jgi:hypothetical protein